MRTAVLLGAGASADAGLPLTNQLAQELVRRFGLQHQRSPLTRVLNFVYGAMVSHETEQGGDPFAAVNVETLFSAIRLLRDRNTHEVAPFASWRAGVGALDASSDARALSRRVEQGALKATGPRFGSGDDLLDAIRAVVHQETGVGGDGTSYAELEPLLRELVAEILSSPVTVDYLSPLADLALSQPGGLDVITLNYDLTIEMMAEQRSVPVRRGIETWRPGEDLDIESADGTINLTKLHGSIDWATETWSRERGTLPQKIARVASGGSRHSDPAIVIGNREKLETEGSTLALLRRFEQSLRRAERLVIVGYSGGDAHVNAVVRDWANADRRRTITVLDPQWPRLNLGWGREDFRDELNRHLGRPGESGDGRRLAAVRAFASDGLARALALTPAPSDPEHWFSVDARTDRHVVTLEVKNDGRDLELTRFYPRRLSGSGSAYPNGIEVMHPAAEHDEHLVHSVSIPEFPAGSSVTVRLTFIDARTAAEWFLQVRGDHELDSVEEKFGRLVG
ncbi:SIR2 family protein [Herbiconiux liukaitaii]|uniref:SIR2 family protein n=1 Tax=Herbiconiux liukaitaii TaxID=3342799 RepID=UPI0035BA3BAF